MEKSFSELHELGRSTKTKTLTHLGHNHKQSFSGLHQLGRSTKTETLTHLGHNRQQSFLGLHQPGRSTSYKHRLTWVTTNNSPSQDYNNPDDRPATNIDSPGSQPTTVLLRTTPTRTINQLQTSTHLGHNQQQSFLGLQQPGRSTSYKH